MADIAIIGLSGNSIFLEVEEFHNPGETIIAKRLHTEPGGKGYNQAACLLKLGSSVAYLSTIGTDQAAKDCYHYLNQKHATLYFEEVIDEKTALATILTDKHGNNQVTVYPGASKHLSLNHLKKFQKEIESAKVLLLTLELPLEIVNEAIKIANGKNVKVVLNPAPYKKDFKNIFNCDYLIPNEIEAKQLFGLKLTDNIFDKVTYIKENYLKENLKGIIITLGSNGCLYISKKMSKHISGIQVDSLDTTGAGDVFNATFTHFYKEGVEIEIAIEYANIAAAMSTTKKHVLNSLPELDEILKTKKI